MGSKISPKTVQNYAIVLFFIGLVFMLFYNNIAGYKMKSVGELSDDDVGSKLKVCGIVESIKEGTTMFLEIGDENSGDVIKCVIFQKDINIIDLELSDYNYSVSKLSEENRLCVEGRYEEYNGEFEIIVKRISEIGY